MSSEPIKTACADRILEAALEVFREVGYGASIEAVACRAQVARQTIYNHYGSKQALFEAALEKAIAQFFSTVKADAGDLRERLIRFGMALRAQALSADTIQLQRVLTSEAPRFPELAESFFRHCVVGSHAQMAEVLEKAMRDGQLRRDDPREAARLFMEMLTGLDRSRMLFGGPAPNPDGEAERVARTVDFFLRAYAPARATGAAAVSASE